MSLSIKKLKVHNFMGIQELEVEPGKFNVIEAKNGSGKTSFIEAIKDICSAGAKDVTVLRNGQEAEVYLELSDGSTLKKTTDEGGVNLKVKVENKTIQNPAGFINNLVEVSSLNPIKFMNGDKKTRMKMLLKTIKTNISEQQLLDLFSEFFSPDDYDKDNIFKTLDSIRKKIYDERTFANREIKNLNSFSDGIKKSIDDLKASNSADGKDAFDHDILSGEDGFKKCMGKIDEAETRAKNELEAEQNRINEKLNQMTSAENAIIREKQEAIEKIKKEIAEINLKVSQIESAAKVSQEKAKNKYSEKCIQIKSDREALVSKRSSFEAIERQKIQLEKNTKELEKAKEKYYNLENLMDKLDGLKVNILKNSPFPSIEIKEDDIYVGDVHFDRINTAEKIKISLDICSRNTGKLSIICVDGLECLDADNFSIFKEEALKRDGVQYFVTRVSDNKNDSIRVEVSD